MVSKRIILDDYILDKPIFLNAYTEAGKSFASHETVEYGKGEYVRGKAHINTAEGYFSQLKRSIDGTHHHVSAHHLHRYLGEFDYRYNTSKPFK